MNILRNDTRLPLDEQERERISRMITAAIERSPHKWRTARAIARQMRMPEKLVSELMRTSSDFVRSRRPNANGMALYTTTNRYQTETPFWVRVLGAAANTVAE